MKVTKAQAQLNRAHIVETASSLFREHGFDGVGVADLMAAAGFTHGGFYRHFDSKVDLMVESAACGIAQTAALMEGSEARDAVRQYLSREHRDARGAGCTMAALGADAARQTDAVRTVFAGGVDSVAQALLREGNPLAGLDSKVARRKALDILARAVGAIVLSRACPDNSPLADEILAACREEILSEMRSSTATRNGSRKQLRSGRKAPG